MLSGIRSLIVLAVLVGGIGLIGFLFRDRLSGAAGDLQVGDCFDVPTVATVENVQHQPCSEAHDGEVFLVRDYPASGSYPGAAAFQTWVTANCLGSTFEGYVGTSFDERTDIDVVWFSPTEDGWGDGDHEMACVLSPVDGSKVSSSYRSAP